MVWASAHTAAHEISAGAILGFIGEPRVNVLELNLALDSQAPVRANAAR